MRKVPGDAQRAARGLRKSGEERGEGESHQGRSSSSSFDKQNKQSSKHQTKFVFLTIIVFFSLPGILTSQLYIKYHQNNFFPRK